ncbi:DUF5688 family protein [Anaerosporobacter sp.]|uniref:DUF5688 family protein n=1 Tax=Anaerosporobacter sp. TaxID=1872529 RepID=UPI00286FA414|nr:DUF5688 family protein [Anaerosporobacter sp.]
MQYEDFLAHMQVCIEQMAAPRYQVQFHSVIKNNDVEQNGVVLMKEGERVSPTVYVNTYYERYLQGESIPKLSKEIVELRIHTVQEHSLEEVADDMSLEKWKDRIVYRVVNRKSNRKRLAEIPFMQFVDLAITFHCVVRNDDNGIGSFIVTRDLMESWNLTVKGLYQFAGVNTPKLFPSSIRTMEEVLQELFIEELSPSIITEEVIEDVKQEIAAQAEFVHSMYILSNLNNINGASALLYPNVIENFSNQIQSNIYILPSSIHEVILVPFQEEIDKSQLIQMVSEVNETQVAAEEVLSSNIYYYDRMCKEIMLEE